MRFPADTLLLEPFQTFDLQNCKGVSSVVGLTQIYVYLIIAAMETNTDTDLKFIFNELIFIEV